jgi:hypothetical protein
MTDDARRDRWGRYLVVPPTGGAAVGYTRATTVAKALDDGGGLLPWKATATVLGAMRRPGLHARWQALIAEHPDPWYGSKESKAACKKLVEECAEAGGSTDRADIGTALHALIQMGNREGATPILQPSMRADVDAYWAAITAAGIIIDPAYVETQIVVDRFRVAGTSDNLRLTLPGVGDVAGDLKTGTDLQYSWQSIAVQLAIYAHGDNVYRQGAASDGSDDVRSPMPELNTDVGLIIHLPAGEARCVLYIVDLVAGWEAAEHSMWARGWRSRRDIASEYATRPRGAAAVATPSPTTTAPPDPPPFDGPGEPARIGEHPSPRSDPATGPRPVDPPPFDVATMPIGTPLRLDGGRFVPVHPEALPPAPPPFDDAPAPALALQRGLLAEYPAEGRLVDDGDRSALATAYTALTDVQRGWASRMSIQATHHRLSFHFGSLPSVRRFEIIRALVILCQLVLDDDGPAVADANVRDIIAAQLGDVAHDPRLTPGELVGSLDADGAALFATRADTFVNGTVEATVDATGKIVLHFAA